MAVTVSNIRIVSPVDSPYIAPGETITVSFDVTNGNNQQITLARPRLEFRDYDLSEAFDITDTGYQTVAIAVNATATVTTTLTVVSADNQFFTWMASQNMRGTKKLYLCGHLSANGTTVLDMGTALSGVGAMLQRYGPKVTMPAGNNVQMCKRCDYDAVEGETAVNNWGIYALLSAKISLTNTSGYSLGVFKPKLYIYTPDETGSVVINGMDLSNVSIGGQTVDYTSQLLTGVTDSDILVDIMRENNLTFPVNAQYLVYLSYGDEYEQDTMATTLLKAFANVHLSGCSTGGVALGKFSESEENDPLFECAYPAEFNDGITVSGGVKGAHLYSDTADVYTGDTWIDGNPILRKSFSGRVSSSGWTNSIGMLSHIPTAIVRITGGVYFSYTGLFYPVPHASFAIYVHTGAGTGGGNGGEVDINVGSGFDMSGSRYLNYAFTVEYAANI